MPQSPDKPSLLEKTFGEKAVKRIKPVSLEQLRQKQAAQEEKAKTPEGSLNYEQLKEWLEKNNLADKLLNLEGQPERLETLISNQERYYQAFYGPDFKLGRHKIFIESDRLPLIQKGLANGSINYPLIEVIPETLTKQEKEQTETEYVYHKLLEPLKDKIQPKNLKIWAETGAEERWTNLTLNEWLKRVIPVELADFDIQALEQDWQTEIKRIIGLKKQPPQVKSGQIKLIWTDNRQDVPQKQELINQSGREIQPPDDNKRSFIEMIKNQVKALTPAQWLILASQKYHTNQEYLSLATLDWLMAVLDHSDKGIDPPVSAACAHSAADGVRLNSGAASSSFGLGRWRACF